MSEAEHKNEIQQHTEHAHQKKAEKGEKGDECRAT
jgi:hypothetical protein